MASSRFASEESESLSHSLGYDCIVRAAPHRTVSLTYEIRTVFQAVDSDKILYEILPIFNIKSLLICLNVLRYDMLAADSIVVIFVVIVVVIAVVADAVALIAREQILLQSVLAQRWRRAEGNLLGCTVSRQFGFRLL